VGFLAAGKEGKAFAPPAKFCEDCVRLGVGLGRAELLAELTGCDDLGGASQLGVGAGAAEALFLVGRDGNSGVFPGTFEVGGLLFAAQVA
jgi:hypothetical protein